MLVNFIIVKQVNIHEAKTHISQLLSQAVLGEEIVIAKAGKPIVLPSSD